MPGTGPRPLFVAVSGPPASGKSTLAPPLARRMALPLVAKDTIKDALMSVLAAPDVDAVVASVRRADPRPTVGADGP